jgi:phospholipid transport system substrate-binding protein
MIFRLIPALIALIALSPLAGVAASGTAEDARQYLHSAIDEVLAIADKAKSKSALIDRVSPVLERHISFSTMTRRAIGPGWRTFNPDQQQKAVTLFTKLVIRSYCNKFTIGEHPEVQYKSAVAVAAGRVDVSTTTVYQGTRFSVVYRMEREGGWRATDIVAEGVSMVANYRSQLDPVFKNGGADAVLSSLQQSAARSQ